MKIKVNGKEKNIKLKNNKALLSSTLKFLGYKKGDFPVAEKLVKKVLAFPHHQHLTKNEIIKVANTINNFYKKKYENSL